MKDEKKMSKQEENGEKKILEAVAKEEIGDTKNTFFAFVSLYRLRVSLVLIVIGFLLFSVQMFTASTPARPDKVFAWLLVRDMTELNAELERREQAAKAAEEAGEVQVPNQQQSPLPLTEGHYVGKPNEGFDERFSTFSEKLSFPEGIVAFPVNMIQVDEKQIVTGGVQQTIDETDVMNPVYYQLNLRVDDTRILLSPYLTGSDEIIGKSYIGPFPFSPVTPAHRLRDAESGVRDLRALPGEASALQGMIVTPREEITPNAYLLVSSGDTNVGDFAVHVNRFNTELLNEYRAIIEQDIRPEMIPNIGFTDVRHGLPVYLATTFGELIFMVGGFLFIFHFFVKLSSRERKEKSLVMGNLIDTSRMIVDQSKLYMMVVGIFLAFWFWGMIASFVDPGGQQKLVQFFQAQLAGTSWPLGFAGQAYSSGNIIEAAFATFVVNFLWGTVVVLTLFSLIPIGSAFIINAFRGQMIGLALSPTKLFFGQSLAPHLITIVIELQGYLIAGFISVLLPLALLKPQRFGCETRLEAFKKFAKWQFSVLPMIAIILALAAVYEAIEIILLKSWL